MMWHPLTQLPHAGPDCGSHAAPTETWILRCLYPLSTITDPSGARFRTISIGWACLSVGICALAWMIAEAAAALWSEVPSVGAWRLTVELLFGSKTWGTAERTAGRLAGCLLFALAVHVMAAFSWPGMPWVTEPERRHAIDLRT